MSKTWKISLSDKHKKPLSRMTLMNPPWVVSESHTELGLMANTAFLALFKNSRGKKLATSNRNPSTPILVYMSRVSIK